MSDIEARLRGQEPLELGDRLAAADEIARLRAEVAYEREARQAETNRANGLRAEVEGLRPKWISASEEKPVSGRSVLAYYKNSLGKGRIVRAQWLARFTEVADGNWDEAPADYCEEHDEYYTPEGWYERIDNWDDYTSVAIYEGEVLYWMEMPRGPE